MSRIKYIPYKLSHDERNTFVLIENLVGDCAMKQLRTLNKTIC